MKIKNRIPIFNKNSSIFIATFSHYKSGKRLPRNGMVDPLLSYFLPKVKSILLLDQPHLISDTISPIIEVYNKRRIKKKFILSFLFYLPIYLICKIPSREKTRISFKLRDFFSVIFVGLTQKDRFDLFIGLEAINALAGILLRKIGKINIVIYYVSDYSPTRFGKTYFNKLYLMLDLFCVRNSDYTWDVSNAMKAGRIETGALSTELRKVIHVPNGLFESQIQSLPIPERDLKSLVYLGSLDYEFGVDLAIKSIKILKKRMPKITLHIIGDGRDSKKLKTLVKKLGIKDSVIFYGFVKDNEEMAKIVRSCYIGLAPYKALSKLSRWYAWYGDAGKIRQYIASGLPVITTQVPPLGVEIVKQGAGIMTRDNVKDFSESIIKLLLDKELYKNLTEKAEKLSKGNTWENSYRRAIEDMAKLGKNLG